jgi:ribosome-binding protein aMBF1 (putative translation factor)
MRQRKGWTAARLAKECEIRPSVLCRYESGERHCSTRMLLVIAEVLGVGIMYFIDGSK